MFSEAPEVFVSTEQHKASVGDQVSVSCNVSGFPHPELHWLNKLNGQTIAGSNVRFCRIKATHYPFSESLINVCFGARDRSLGVCVWWTVCC